MESFIMRIIDYIAQGGPIMYVLLFLNIIGIAIMLTKFFMMSSESKKTSETAELLGQQVKSETTSEDIHALIEVAKQHVANYIGHVEKGLNTIKIIAAISPLLGLLGTVIGVLIAFKVMSQTGLNNPASFAQGISMALITTVGGLIVAIPHYIGHNYLLGMLDRLEADIEKRVLTKLL
jgi:biopolymer transport protein ExbB